MNERFNGDGQNDRYNGEGQNNRYNSQQSHGSPLYDNEQAFASYSSRSFQQQSPQVPSKNSFSVLTLIRMVLYRWLTVVLCAVLGVVASVFYIQTATPIYKAQAVLEMSVRRPKVINNEAVFEDPTAGRDVDVIFNTRFAKFKSPAMERLAATEYLAQYPDEKHAYTGREIGRYSLAVWMKDVRWYKDPSANIVYVTYESEDPKFAAQLVNVLSFCGGQLMAEENQAQSDEAVKWLIEQANNQRQMLDVVEKELGEKRQDLQLDSLQQRKAALNQAIITVASEKEALLSALVEKKTLHSFVDDLKEDDPDVEMLPAGLPKESEFNELIRQWRRASDDLELAGDRYTEIHPEYRKFAEIEDRSRMRLRRFMDLSEKTLQNEVNLLEQQIGENNSRITKMKDEAVGLELSIAQGLRELQRLERKRDAADTSYQSMLRRMEEARLSADENMAFTKVIRNASEPQIPVSPQKGRVLVMGTFCGGLIGCLLALLTAFWTDKISSVADLKAYNLRILATIPSQKRLDSRADLAMIGLRDNFNPLVEIFAGLNTVITSGTIIKGVKVILTNSVGPGEGKTISACNLAISSATNGSKTLLIDGDLRRPQLAKVFNVDETEVSFLEWLTGDVESSFKGLISENIIENLDLITSRSRADINPAELLGRKPLEELVEWARGRYDRIIIDSPPIGAVGDAQVLGKLADVIIFVARIGTTKKRAIRFGLARYAEIDTPMIGCIANDVPHSLAGMFGGAEGYGAYGYGSYKV